MNMICDRFASLECVLEEKKEATHQYMLKPVHSQTSEKVFALASH